MKQLCSPEPWGNQAGNQNAGPPVVQVEPMEKGCTPSEKSLRPGIWATEPQRLLDHLPNALAEGSGGSLGIWSWGGGDSPDGIQDESR